MKKGVKALSFALVGMLMLSGCGSKETSSNSEKGGTNKEYKVGISQFAPHPSLDAATQGFKQALKDKGLKVKFDEQNAQADINNTQSIAKNFVGEKEDLIFANATPSATAALNATKEIPIIFTSVTDPVGSGLVKSFDKPGGNITGTTDNHPDATKKTISFITDEVKAKKIGVIYNSGEENSRVQVKAVKKITDEKGAKLIEVSVSNTSEVKQAAETTKVGS